jgi:paraquat-inducible protein B
MRILVAENNVPEDDLPLAVADVPRTKRLPFIWVLPILVVVVGGFVVVQQKLAQGPEIDIDFQSADGLEANKTKIRYKDVDVGDVTDIHVSKDRKKVVVTARIHRDASEYLVEDSRFWVVRPRLTGGGVTGLGTHNKRRHFSGLEVPPIVTSDLPGREYVLRADDIGSLSVGSTVFYRHIAVGQVIAYALDPGGSGVTIKIFVYEPFDNYVGTATRFWQASGIDMSINSDGVKLQTESLTSILQGGVAFQSPPQAPASSPAAADTSFTLFTDRERALRQSESEVRTFIMYFAGSLRGLSVGAPIDLRGITIGEVKSLSVEYAGTLRFPVQVDIYPQRIRGRSRRNEHPAPADETSETSSRNLVDSLVAHGMRAEIKTGNLLTGQKYVAMDFHNEVPPDHVGWNAQPPVFPTTSGALDEIQDSIGSIAKKLDKVPFDQISAHLVATLATLEDTLKNSDRLIRQVDGTLAPQVNATLKEAEGAMKSAKELLAEDAPLQNDLTSTLLQLSRAAKSVSALVDYLERHPESLLRGKPGDSK